MVHISSCQNQPKGGDGGQAGEEGAAREVVNAADKEMDELITLGRPRSYKPHYQTGRFSSK